MTIILFTVRCSIIYKKTGKQFFSDKNLNSVILIVDLPGPLCYCNVLKVDLTVIYIMMQLIIKLDLPGPLCYKTSCRFLYIEPNPTGFNK